MSPADVVAATDRVDETERVDVLIVGGGIAGVGVLQAAAAAGYDALLLERTHVAAGTSSKSSKLIHGGLRYLESAQLGLVRESLAERQILLRVAPDLVKLVPFFIPVRRGMTRSSLEIRAGLSLYALLGNLGKDARFRAWPRARWDELDGLSTAHLKTVFRYYDGQTDDAALCRAVLRSALELGARAIVPAEFRRALRQGDDWLVSWSEGDRAHQCLARTLVNAGGPWINQVRDRIEPRPPGFDVELVQGAHVELEGEQHAGIYYLEAPRDRRAVFAIPWKGRTMVGTTETARPDPSSVRALDAEVDYLLETFANWFPTRPRVVVDRWAGARVLPRSDLSAFQRPRDVTLIPDDKSHPRTLAIYGGKLTGYRATAEKVVERLALSLGPRPRRGDTRTLRLTPDPAHAEAASSSRTKRT